MPRPKKAEAVEPQAVEEVFHPLICPFSGKPMEIRVVGPDSYFMVISPHGFTSKLMQTREQCLEWASFRSGSQNYKSPVIMVRSVEEPDYSAESGLIDIMPDPDSVNDEDLPESLR
jgi:hypothetical protein